MKRALSTLTDLGLTSVQAKVYIALNKLDASTISEISKISKVHRTDLYAILKNLEEKGLAERQIDHPTKYQAIPMSEGLNLLLEKKSKKYSDLQIKVAELKSVFKKTAKSKPENNNESKFVLIPEKRIVQSVGKSIDRAQRSVDLVLSLPRLSKGLVVFSEKMEKSCCRGTNWRFIIDKPSKEKLFLNQIRGIREKTRCQIKFLPFIPPTILGIYDKKEVFIFKNPSESISESPALWSDNKCLLSIVADYFEMLWFTALEDEFQETED